MYSRRVVSASDMLAAMNEDTSQCERIHCKTGYEESHPQYISPVAATGHSVLIVDDFEPNRSLLKHIMRHLGFENIDVAESGETGLNIWKQHQHSLILLDYQMDGIDGYETCRRIRRFVLGESPTILGVSSTVHAGNLDLAIQAGFCGQIPKPISRHRLKEMLESLGWGFDPIVRAVKNA